MAVITVQPAGTLRWRCRACGQEWPVEELGTTHSLLEAANHERACGPVRVAPAIELHYRIDDGELFQL